MSTVATLITLDGNGTSMCIAECGEPLVNDYRLLHHLLSLSTHSFPFPCPTITLPLSLITDNRLHALFTICGSCSLPYVMSECSHGNQIVTPPSHLPYSLTLNFTVTSTSPSPSPPPSSPHDHPHEICITDHGDKNNTVAYDFLSSDNNHSFIHTYIHI